MCAARFCWQTQMKTLYYTFVAVVAMLGGCGQEQLPKDSRKNATESAQASEPKPTVSSDGGRTAINPVANLNRQIKRFNSDRPKQKGIAPIEQRIARVEYLNEQDMIECFDAQGAVVLTLKRHTDGRFVGTVTTPYHELPRPDGHRWGQVAFELSLPKESFTHVQR